MGIVGIGVAVTIVGVAEGKSVGFGMNTVGALVRFVASTPVGVEVMDDTQPDSKNNITRRSSPTSRLIFVFITTSIPTLQVRRVGNNRIRLQESVDIRRIKTLASAPYSPTVIKSLILSNVPGPTPETSMISSIEENGPFSSR